MSFKYLFDCFSDKTTDQEELQICMEIISKSHPDFIGDDVVEYVYCNLSNPKPTALLENVKFDNYEEFENYLRNNVHHVNALCDGKTWLHHEIAKENRSGVMSWLVYLNFNFGLYVPEPEDLLADYRRGEVCIYSYLGTYVPLQTIMKRGFNPSNLLIQNLDKHIGYNVIGNLIKKGFHISKDEAITNFKKFHNVTLNFLQKEDVSSLEKSDIILVLESNRLSVGAAEKLLKLLLDRHDEDILDACVECILTVCDHISLETVIPWFDYMKPSDVSKFVYLYDLKHKTSIAFTCNKIPLGSFKYVLMAYPIVRVKWNMNKLDDDKKLVAQTYVGMVESSVADIRAVRHKKPIS